MINAPVPPPRLYRARDGRMVAGVAAGIAQHLGIPAMRVRIAFVVLLGLSGLGLLLYAAFWAVVPVQPGESEPPPRRDLFQLLPFVAIKLIDLVLVAAGA